MSKEEVKISDVFPLSRTYEFKNGKKAVIGLLTLGDLTWLEEKFGGLDKFMAKGAETGKLSETIELLYRLCENKAEFKDLSDFANHAPLATFNPMDVLQWSLGVSMPKPSANGGKKGN